MIQKIQDENRMLLSICHSQLISKLKAKRADDCMSSGRRNCNPIEAPRR